MSYVLLFGLSASSFVKKRSKVLYAFLLVYAIIIFCYNTNNPDLFNYTYHYAYGGRGMEPIYTLLEGIFGMLGADYIVLRITLCIFGMILLTKSFWDFSPYPNILFSLYLFYPFPLEVVQVRTFVANALIVYSLRFIIFYLKDKKKINIFYFTVTVLIATGFHYAAILSAILGIVFLDEKQRSILVTLILAIAIVLCANLPFFGALVEKITGSANAGGWVMRYRIVSLLQMFRLIATRGLIIFMLWLWQKVKAKSSADMVQVENAFYDKSVNRCILQCVLYISLYTVIEILFGGNFERINRVAIIFSMLLVTRQIQRVGRENKILMWSISVVAFTLNFFSVMIGKSTANGAYINTVFRTVFENNQLF